MSTNTDEKPQDAGYMSAAELADMLDISMRRVQQLAHEHDIRKLTRNKYNVIDVLAALGAVNLSENGSIDFPRSNKKHPTRPVHFMSELLENEAPEAPSMDALHDIVDKKRWGLFKWENEPQGTPPVLVDFPTAQLLIQYHKQKPTRRNNPTMLRNRANFAFTVVTLWEKVREQTQRKKE